MVEPIRFFFDQHIPFAVANRLRQRGVDVLTAQEARRCGLPDTDQLRFATVQRRVMVTFDRDYLLLDASSVSIDCWWRTKVGAPDSSSKWDILAKEWKHVLAKNAKGNIVPIP
jgi:hypothetical protein